MGFPRIFSSQVTPPVVTLNHRAKSGDLHDSFGSDFERLGQTSPLASKSPTRPWGACPVRRRSTPGGTMQVSYHAWLADLGRDCHAAMAMKAGPAACDAVSGRLRNWQKSFLTDIDARRRFEGDRHDALHDIGRAGRVSDAPHLRAFPMGACQVQVKAIAGLSTWLARQSASRATSALSPGDPANDAAPEAAGRTIAQIAARLAMLAHATDLRDTMFVHTAKSISNRIAQLTCERRDLFLLNDMTREAEDIVGRAGERVPLRLALRGDKCILKPAKSRSMFPACVRRARREAAALAMMLGHSPNEPVTLQTLRDQGFGRHESTVLLGDARWAGPLETARDESWLCGRIRELENAKRVGLGLLETMRESVARSYRAAAPALAVDDSAPDAVAQTPLAGPAEPSLSRDAHEPARAAPREAMMPSEGTHRRASCVDDLTPEALTPPLGPPVAQSSPVDEAQPRSGPARSGRHRDGPPSARPRALPGLRSVGDMQQTRRPDKFEEEADRVLAWHAEAGKRASQRARVMSVPTPLTPSPRHAATPSTSPTSATSATSATLVSTVSPVSPARSRPSSMRPMPPIRE